MSGAIPANEPLTDEEWEALIEYHHHGQTAAYGEGDFWAELEAMQADNLVIPDWWEDDRQKEWLAIARWRLERGHQLTPRDLGALAWAADAILAGKLPSKPRGRPVAIVTPRQHRKRQLLAKYLRDKGLALEVIASMMGIGIEARDVPELVEGASARSFTMLNTQRLDTELMAEILTEYKTR